MRLYPRFRFTPVVYLTEHQILEDLQECFFFSFSTVMLRYSVLIIAATQRKFYEIKLVSHW